MSALADELAELTREEERIAARKREVYAASVQETDPSEKVCEDGIAKLLADHEPLPGLPFPFEVRGLSWRERSPAFEPWKATPEDPLPWVSVRPVDARFGGKTLLGVRVGHVALSVMVSVSSDGFLVVGASHLNPLIYMPDALESVLGCGSWWGRIASPEALRAISDVDIQGVWYVRALDDLLGLGCAAGRHSWPNGIWTENSVWQTCERKGCQAFRHRRETSHPWTEEQPA